MVGRKLKENVGAWRRTAAGRLFFKTFAWIMAVPALCALVVLGGAAPIYLLLPDAPSGTVQQAENGTKSGVDNVPDQQAALSPPAALESEPVEPLVEGEIVPGGALDAPPLEESPVEEDVAHLSVVPTPRPPLAASDGPATESVDARSVEPPPTKTKLALASPRPKPKSENSQSGGWSATIRPVPLRTGPGGREIAVLARGARVLVGRCEGWCEVQVDGLQGWIHPSFLTMAAGERARTRTDGQRNIRRSAERRDDYRVIDDAPRRGAWRPEEPERFTRDDPWLAEDRDPVEYYGYE